MSRNKYPEKTVEKILQISAKLFIEKGYDNTSIQDIVNELQMTKGAIYHHFKSKEELLQKITTTYFSNMDWFFDIKKDSSLNGLEKIKKVFLYELENEEKKKIDRLSYPLYKNSQLLANQLHSCIYDIAPEIKSLIDEGILDKSINTKNSKHLSEVLILLVNFWISPAVFPTDENEFMEKVNFVNQMLEGVGISIWDEELKKACLNYYKSVK